MSGRNLHGLIFLQRVPRVAKSVPTYILTVATTKAIVIISVILILPNWLYSVVYVLQWISDYYKHILCLSLCQTFLIYDYVCAKRPEYMVTSRCKSRWRSEELSFLVSSPEM